MTTRHKARRMHGCVDTPCVLLTTQDWDYARLLIDMYERKIPIIEPDRQLYTIVGYEVTNNDEIINYGGLWGGTPGLYRVARPATYQFELQLYKGA